MKPTRIGSWGDVEALLRDRPPDTVLTVPRSWVEHPSAHGMKASFGLPAGQLADYVKRLDETTGLEVAAFQRHYTARLVVTEAPPRNEGSGHGGALGNGVALGALLGAALGRSDRAVVVGAALGCLLSAGARPVKTGRS
jgi:hypothetical protein